MLWYRWYSTKCALHVYRREIAMMTSLGILCTYKNYHMVTWDISYEALLKHCIDWLHWYDLSYVPCNIMLKVELHTHHDWPWCANLHHLGINIGFWNVLEFRVTSRQVCLELMIYTGCLRSCVWHEAQPIDDQHVYSYPQTLCVYIQGLHCKLKPTFRHVNEHQGAIA